MTEERNEVKGKEGRKEEDQRIGGVSKKMMEGRKEQEKEEERERGGKE